MLAKEKTWKCIFNTNSELSQNNAEKQIIPSKTTVNWLSNDIWCYLVNGCFDWKNSVFQQTVVRIYYIFKSSKCDFWISHFKNLTHTKFRDETMKGTIVITENVNLKWRILLWNTHFGQIFKSQYFGSVRCWGLKSSGIDYFNTIYR